MKIVNIKTFIVGMTWKNWVFVKVETDEGMDGLGEATCNVGSRAVETILQDMKNAVIGQDPNNIEKINSILEKFCSLHEERLLMRAISAINIALWDIKAKIAGLPLYQLLGGKTRDEVRAYANSWYKGPRDPVFLAERAKETVSLGYTALKFDPFGSSYLQISREELSFSMNLVEAVMLAVGDKADVMIEAHDRFSFTTAVEIGKRLGEYSPMWYEAPCRSTDIPLTANVAEHVPVPVATGERYVAIRQAREMLSFRSVGYLQPETLGIGGVSGIMKTLALAEAYSTPVAPHNAQSPLCTMLNTHLAIANSGIVILEYFDEFNEPQFNELFISGLPQVKNGYIQCPSNAPGIGVTLNEELCGKYPFNSGSVLRLFENGWERRGSK